MLKFRSKAWVIGLFIGGLALPAMAQENRAALDDAIAGFESTAHQRFQGVRDDWSDHHVVYSRPEPGSDAEFKAQHDARFWLQQIKRNLNAAQFDPPVPYGTRVDRQKKKPSLKKDWTASLGTTGTSGAGMFPAKFSFAPVGPPVCTGTGSDYVVFNTSETGSTTQASIIAFNNLYASPTCSSTGSATIPEVFWAYNTGGRVITSPSLSLDGTQLAFVQDTGAGTAASLVLLKWAQNPSTISSAANGTTVAGTTITTGTIFFAAGDVGARISSTGGHIPAGATITAVASGTSATISAAATAGTALTFTIAAETAAAPGVPVTVTAANYHTCTAPCMTTMAFSGTGTHSDTKSSPFYDTSGTNTIFVADNINFLHQFNNVFTGSTTPAEKVTTPWPVHAGTTAAPLNSPVYDSNDNLVFIGDGHLSGGTVDGEIHSVNATTGAVVSTASICHGVSFGYTDSFLIDPVAGEFYSFCSADTQITGANACSAAGQACVRQFPVAFTAASQGTPANLTSTTQLDANMFAGAFDEGYFTSSATTPTGHLYACGNPNGDPIMYQIPITNGVMGASTAAVTVGTTSGSQCAPVTEVYNPNLTNGPFDFLFLSVQAGGAATGCSGGCVMNFIATQWQANHAYTGGQEILDNLSPYHIQKVTTLGTSGATEPVAWSHAGSTTTDGTVHWTDQGTMLANSVGASEAGGTSGISVDNVSGLTGASQIYFSTITPATSLAVQASQSSP